MTDNSKTYFLAGIKIILFILLLLFLYFIRDLILILIISFIIATILLPPVDWLVKKKVSRLLATLFIYLLFFLTVIGIFILIIPNLSEEIGIVGQKISSYYQTVRTFIGSSQKFLPQDLTQIPGLEQGLATLGRNIFFLLSNVAYGIFSIFLIIVISFYIIVSKDSIANFFFSFVPEKYHQFFSRLIFLSRKSLSRWGWAMLILISLIGSMTYIGLSILRVRFALSLAVFAGLMEVIPYIGPFIGAVPAVFLAFFQSPVKALMVIILYILVQQIENNIVVPQVMRGVIGLNPIIVILVLLIGGKFGGVLGAIIAVPVSAVIYIFIKEYLRLKKYLKLKSQPPHIES
ncbi:MAG: AI-2E family transporter [Patescibacteria group bacterium]